MDKALKKKQEELTQILDYYYTRKDLNDQLKKHVISYMHQYGALLREWGLEEYLSIDLKKSLNKTQLLNLCALPFLNHPLFMAFYESLPELNQRLLDLLIWEEKMEENELEEQLDLELPKEKKSPYNFYNYHRGASTVFGFFKKYDLRGDWGIGEELMLYFIPASLRQSISEYYEKPEEAEWLPLTKIDPTEYLYDTGELDIFSELPRLRAYEQQKMIRLTGKNRPMSSTLGKMQRKLKLKEFFPAATDKNLKICRTALLAGMIVSTAKSKKLEEAISFFKCLFNKDFKEYIYSAPIVLHFIKGMGRLDNHYLDNVESSFLDFIATLPLNKWIAMENVASRIRYNFLDFNSISKYYAKDKLYYHLNIEFETGLRFPENVRITADLYEAGVSLPYIKGLLFLFAAFGLLDIAYDTPNTTELGASYFSPYDGLRYVRLTPFGAYLLGQTDSYEASASTTASSFILSKDALMFITQPNDEAAAILLDPFTEQAAPNRYRTDANIFLKGCKDWRDLKSKIALFKQTIGGELPPNWQRFLKQLQEKINPLQAIKAAHVYQVPESQKELLQLIARDPVLKKLALKAEGFHILVLKENYSRFRKRMQELGYLLT